MKIASSNVTMAIRYQRDRANGYEGEDRRRENHLDEVHIDNKVDE